MLINLVEVGLQIDGLIAQSRDLTKLRRRRRRRQQRQRQKHRDNRFYKQNNNSARASHFFVHFFAVPAQLQRKMTKFWIDFRTERQGDKFYYVSDLGLGPLSSVPTQLNFPVIK